MNRNLVQIKDDLIDRSQAVSDLEKKVKEKDLHIRNLLKIIRSLRKYVSY